jgi:hypothetical protein
VVVLTLNIALNQKYPLQGLNQKYPLQGKAPRPEESRPGGYLRARPPGQTGIGQHVHARRR